MKPAAGPAGVGIRAGTAGSGLVSLGQQPFRGESNDRGGFPRGAAENSEMQRAVANVLEAPNPYLQRHDTNLSTCYSYGRCIYNIVMAYACKHIY